MGMQSKDYIVSYEQDLIEKDRSRNAMFKYIEKMVHVDFELPKELRLERPDIRNIRDQTPMDAVENASIALSNTLPKWRVLPYGTNLAEYNRTQMMEEILRREFRKLNYRGVGTVLFDKSRSAIVYNMQATRTDDLLSIFPKNRKTWTPYQKEAFSNGRFMSRVFNPKGVHVEVTSMGMAALCHVEVKRAWDVYQYWKLFENNTTKEGKLVAAGLAKMKKYMDERKEKDKLAPRDLWFTNFYFINHDQIMRHGHFTGASNEVGEPSSSDIFFVDEENEMGFINWSVRIGGSRVEDNPKYQVNPMLAGLYYSKIWETMNLVNSIVLSKPISELERANEAQFTSTGKRLPEKDGVIVGRKGDDVVRPGFPQIDPAVYTVLERLNQTIVQTTGASALGDVTAAKNTPFATLNAIIQVVMGRLDVQRRDISLSCQDDARIMYKHVNHNEQPLVSYRDVGSEMGSGIAGQQLIIGPEDFDPFHLDIICSVDPKHPTDRQQQILSAIQLHEKFMLPQNELLEGLGYENTELLKQIRIREDLENTEHAATMKNIMLQEELRAQNQAKAMAMQNEQGGEGQVRTSQENPGSNIAGGAMGALGPGAGEQFNPAQGGQAFAGAFPGVAGREQVQGVDANGNPTGG